MDTGTGGELVSGSRFGNYVVRECIGHGGMARVYRAEHTALGRSVALKVLDSSLISSPAARQRFLREGTTAAAVKHPNVVDVLDVGFEGNLPYLVMELLIGEDLEQYLQRQAPLADDELVRLALPIIAGMSAAHAVGIVHRDLKPSNIFLARGGEGEIVPKVLDFGISKIGALSGPRATGSHEIIGTPTYLAPEALNGSRELGPESDQYSLGVVLYECATGEVPFRGRTLLALMQEIARGASQTPRQVRPSISMTLDRAIARAMSLDPAARFATLKQLGQDLWRVGDAHTQAIWSRTFGGGTPGAALSLREPSMAGMAGPGPATTHRVAWWIGGGVAFAVALALAVRMGGTEKPIPPLLPAQTTATRLPEALAPQTQEIQAITPLPAPPAGESLTPSPVPQNQVSPTDARSKPSRAETRDQDSRRSRASSRPFGRSTQLGATAESRERRVVEGARETTGSAQREDTEDATLKGLFRRPAQAEPGIAPGKAPEVVRRGANGAPIPD